MLTLVVPKPLESKPPFRQTKERKLLGEYRKAANSIGYRPTELNKIELEVLLEDNHIPVYPYDKVHAYLTDICPDWLIYSWRILRQNHSYSQDRVRNHGEYNYTPYEDNIPENIVMRAALLKSKLEEDYKGQRQPVELEFFASHFSAAAGDPFLLACLRPSRGGAHGEARAVVGQWNERGFDFAPEVK